jgi:prevent-host-death family protein
MITISASEAKNRLSALLDRIAAGEEIVIAKHAKPVARLVGAQSRDRTRVSSRRSKL